MEEYLSNDSENDEVGISQNVFSSGWAINKASLEERYIEEPIVAAVPAKWTIKGVVHIGNGNQYLADTDTVAEMKANPATLTIGAGVVVSAESDNSALWCPENTG